MIYLRSSPSMYPEGLNWGVALYLFKGEYYYYNFFPYQLPPTPYPHQLKLTGYGVRLLLLIFFLSRRKEKKIIYGRLLEQPLLNARTRGIFWLVSLLDGDVASSSVHFPSYI